MRVASLEAPMMGMDCGATRRPKASARLHAAFSMFFMQFLVRTAGLERLPSLRSAFSLHLDAGILHHGLDVGIAFVDVLGELDRAWGGGHHRQRPKLWRDVFPSDDVRQHRA